MYLSPRIVTNPVEAMPLTIVVDKDLFLIRSFFNFCHEEN